MSNFGSGRCISRRLLQLPDVCSGLAAACAQLPRVLQLPRENLTGAGVAPTDAAPRPAQNAAPARPLKPSSWPARRSSSMDAQLQLLCSSYIAAPGRTQLPRWWTTIGDRCTRATRTRVRGTPVRERQFGTYV